MFKSLLSIFLESNCPLCQRQADNYLCKYCYQQLQEYQLDNCSRWWQGDLPLFIWGVYDGKLKRAIAALKYDPHPQLGELMGNWLGKAWLESPLSQQNPKITVIPIPLHEKKLKTRGFNQAEIIAKGFCQITNYTLKPHGLLRVKDTKAMFGLKAEERKENVADAFILGKNIRPHQSLPPVLLIDDICTTGTTVKAAALVLQKNQIEVLGVGAIARPISNEVVRK